MENSSCLNCSLGIHALSSRPYLAGHALFLRDGQTPGGVGWCDVAPWSPPSPFGGRSWPLWALHLFIVVGLLLSGRYGKLKKFHSSVIEHVLACKQLAQIAYHVQFWLENSCRLEQLWSQSLYWIVQFQRHVSASMGAYHLRRKAISDKQDPVGAQSIKSTRFDQGISYSYE